MPLAIPQNDRIINRYAVYDVADKTILNADNVMLIFDNLINGAYALKPAKQYATYEQLQAETEMEAGQTAYVIEPPYQNSFFIYNGTEWVAISSGTTPVDYSLKESVFTITPNETEILTDLDLDNVVSYIVLLNGVKIDKGTDYTVETVNNISTIILSETNQGTVTVVYQ